MAKCSRHLDIIAYLHKPPGMLRGAGFAEANLEAIMHGSWLRFFREAWSC